MRKSLVLVLLICACCAHRLPSSAGQVLSDALLVAGGYVQGRLAAISKRFPCIATLP